MAADAFIKNISDVEQTFTDLPPFAPGESRLIDESGKDGTVSPAMAEILERSPFMEIVGKGSAKTKKMTGQEPENPNAIRGVDPK